MAYIRIFGWIDGADTVRAIKKIREKSGGSLSDALAVVNKVLDDQEVVVELPNREVANELVESLMSMGLHSEIAPTGNRPREKQAAETD